MPEPQADPEPPSLQALTPDVAGLDRDQPFVAERLDVLFAPGKESVPEGLTEHFLQECCHAAMAGQKLLALDTVATVEVSVQLLGREAMRELNRQYRQKDSATNVLSFASGLPLMHSEDGIGAAGDAGSLLILGDLVLCPDVIAREADVQGKPRLHHWAHMLVHGCLHLCGHDHEEESDAQRMEAAEIRILSDLGLPNPYAVENSVNAQ